MARQAKSSTKKSVTSTKKYSKTPGSGVTANTTTTTATKKHNTGTRKLSKASEKKYHFFLAQAADLTKSFVTSTADTFNSPSITVLKTNSNENSSFPDYVVQLQLAMLDHEARAGELRHVVGLRRLARANFLRLFESDVVNSSYEALALRANEYLAKLGTHGDEQVEEIGKIHDKILGLC